MNPDETDRLRLRLIERMLHAPAAELEQHARLLPTTTPPSAPNALEQRPPGDWPHAPLHRLSEEGTYFVTASTLDKAHVFRGAARLDFLQKGLLAHLQDAGWVPEAWAVFSNHYHFVAHMRPGAALLNDVLRELHRVTALHVNQLDDLPGRQVWFQFWDTRLTFEASYLARLSYVHRNAEKHGLVAVACHYRWCSAGWLERTGTRAQVATLYRMRIDRVNVEDDYDPE